MAEASIPPSSAGDSTEAANGGGAGAQPDWYCVRAIYRSVRVGQPRRRHLYERTFFIFRAASGADSAGLEERARTIALGKEQEYVAVGGHTVRWVLDSIEDVIQLIQFDPEEGGEVYWEFFERVDKQPS
jgi:uncharacterized protein DUF4288